MSVWITRRSSPRPDLADRSVRRPEEHVLVQAQDMAEVGIDDASVTHDRQVHPAVKRQYSLDDGHHPMPELVAAFREGRDVPTPLLHEAFLHAVPHHGRQDVLEPDAVRDVTVGLHLPQLRIDHGLQSMRRSDVTGRLRRPNQMAAEHGVERRIGEGRTDRGGLSPTEVRERRIRP